MRNVTRAAVALAFVLLVAASVRATPPSETPLVIRTGDLDVSGDRGMAALNARIAAAADRVCMQPDPGRFPLPSYEQACRQAVRLEIAEHLGALQPSGPVFAAARAFEDPSAGLDQGPRKVAVVVGMGQGG